MIDVHYWPTPNGWKVTIMLEECGLDYNIVPVDIGGGDQFKPSFLRISPNNRMPAIVDHEPLDGGEPLAIFESGAIVEYLAEKTGRFMPSDTPGKYRVLQWVHWQMANLGPMMGNANHFKNYGKNLADDPKQLEYGTKRFVGEVDRLSGVMDAQLGATKYLAGEEYSIADIICWPWVLIAKPLGQSLDDFPRVAAWRQRIKQRPAVQRGVDLGKELRRSAPPSDEERKILFNQTADSIEQGK